MFRSATSRPVAAHVPHTTGKLATHLLFAWLLVLLPIFLGGCSGGSSGTAAAPVAPSITTQPTAQSAYVGGTASFTVAASGTAPLSFQWLRNGSPISGATVATYTSPALALSDDGALFSVTVSNSAGSVTSSTAKLSVSVQAPSIVSAPTAQTVTDGGTASFSVSAGGSPPLSYQWLRNGSPISGATGTSYSLTASFAHDNGALFSVTVSNSAGSVTSPTAKLTVNAAPVQITTQPAARTVFVGETASFSVAATGTGPISYQWRKNAASIPGATSASYTSAAVTASDNNATYDVVVSNAAGSVTSTTATLKVGPFATSYTTQKGVVLQLYAWPGTRNAFLTPTNTLDGAVMRKILNAADGAWDFYATADGKNPSLYFNYNGLATIAVTGVGGVDLCGDGCTYIGATGMELSNNAFSWLYNGVQQANTYDQVMFYELGRSFWLFPNVQYAKPDDSSCEITGYAVLMRYLSLQSLGLTGTFSQSVSSYTTEYNGTLTLIDTYANDPTLNFSNTFLVNKFTTPYGGCTDLWASMMLRLRQKYGGDAFINSVFKQMIAAPAPVTTQDAVDNFVLAASAAAGKNLTYTFGTTWKFPISVSATNTAASKWGAPQ